MTYKPKEYWSKRGTPNQYSTLQQWDIEILKPLCEQAKSILDFGPGNGRTFELYEGKEVVAVDIVDKYKDELHEKADRYEFLLFDFMLTDYVVNYQFDLGVLSKVLLHDPNPKWIIDYVADMCDRVFISTGINCTAEHCFDHDYAGLLKEYTIQEWEQNGNNLTIVFR